MQLFKLENIERYLFHMLQRVGAFSSGFAIRPSDEEIRKVFIDKAKNEFNSPEFVTGNPADYLPTMLSAKEYLEFESGPLLQPVLLNEEDHEPVKLASRVPYLISTPKYDPISSLTTDLPTFLAAFFALFYCKFRPASLNKPCSRRPSRSRHALERRYSTRRHQR